MFKQTARLTKPQLIALKKVYDRTPLFNNDTASHVSAARRFNVNPYGWNFSEAEITAKDFPNLHRVSFREFRRSVIYQFDCILVPWVGMFLGIEHDGYTHS